MSRADEGGLSLFLWSSSSELIRGYAVATKMGAGGLLSLRGLREEGIDVTGNEAREVGGYYTPYSTAENNKYIAYIIKLESSSPTTEPREEFNRSCLLLQYTSKA